MRPVRLELQGFTCYREKQEIDFTRLGLFAIAGPTGSGKSSLLDAITFALYGKVPRLGGQNLDEFISLGASRASVVLDFDMQGERFRIVRSMPRSGAKRAQIEQITDGRQRALCDGVGDVNERVRALLGLDYEAFIQSVLLPQGDFAKFLKSNPKDQQKILRDLLRLGVYEKMREKAGNEARELSSSLDAARGLLEGPYAQATVSNLKLIEADLVETLKNKDAATAELETRRKTLQTIQGQWVLVEERQQRSNSLDALHRERPQIDEFKKSIARANQAKSAVPALDVVVAKTRALKDLETEGRDLEEKLKAAQNDVKTKSGDLRSAEQEALGLTPKRKRIVKLASVVPVLEEHRSWTSRRNEDSTNLARSEKAIVGHKDRVSKAQTCLETTQRQREQLVQQQSGLGYDVTAHTILQRAQRLSYELAQARESERNLGEPLEMAHKLQQQTWEAFEAKTSAHEEAEQKHSDALKAAQAAAADFTEAQNQERAAALRSTLHSGCLMSCL